MFPIVQCDIHIHLPFQVRDVFRNYCEDAPNTSSEKHDGNTRNLTLSSAGLALRWTAESAVFIETIKWLGDNWDIRPGQCRPVSGLPWPGCPGWCLGQVTGPVTGATLIKREITTFLASPHHTTLYSLLSKYGVTANFKHLLNNAC